MTPLPPKQGLKQTCQERARTGKSVMTPLPPKQGLKRSQIVEILVEIRGYDTTSTKTRIETSILLSPTP